MIWVVILSFLFRAFFALKVGLIDDEAYHWSWAKELQLSYFDHPGLIAWSEWMTTYFFGDTVLGVRLPAFLFFALTVGVSWLLARDLFGRWAANFVALVLLWSPFFGFGGYVASPEPPFMFFWVLSAWIFWQGHREDKKQWGLARTWVLLGFTMGLGLNSKFITALLALGFGLYLLSLSNRRKDLLTKWPWIGFLIATLICAPIFMWNYQNDWPGFRYQFHDRHATTTCSLQRWIEFFGTQFIFYTPFLYLLILRAIEYSFQNLKLKNWRFLFFISLPSFLLFYPQPLWAEYKPHWSGSAVLLLLMGVGALLDPNGHRRAGPGQDHLEQDGGIKNGMIKSRFWVRSTVVLFVFMNLTIYLPFAHPWLPKAHAVLFPQTEWNPRQDLSNEFFGWAEFGGYLLQLQEKLRSPDSGAKPFLSSHRYETTAQTYWGTKQKTYMLGRAVSHYTVMQKLQGLDPLLGQDTLFIATDKYPQDPLHQARFDSCEELPPFEYHRESLWGPVPSRKFFIYHCRNFQGIHSSAD